jgi:D-alanyl-D-alanine dipeptidase
MLFSHAGRKIAAAFVLLLLLAGCAGQQGAFHPGRTVKLAEKLGLVDVRKAVPGIVVDLRYTTGQNVTGQPLYPRRMPCLLLRSTSERLKLAQAALKAQGYGLKIWDAWRPAEAQGKLHAHGGKTGMFLNPQVGWSRHCGGVSLDATLVDAEGREQPMPTYFDENLAHAASSQTPADPVVRRNLAVLHRAMREAGLMPLPAEWWHFDDIDFLYDPVPVIHGSVIGVPIR